MTSNKKYEDILAPLGYQISKVFQDNERTFVAKVTHHAGDHAIFKFAKSQTVSLKTEEWFSHVLEQHAAGNNPSVRGPAFYAHGNDWHIREFLQGPAISKESESHRTDFRRYASPLVEALLYLDRLTDIYGSPPQETDGYLSRYENLESIKHPLNDTMLFIDDEITSYRRILNSGAPASLEPRLQHGDFAPWHMYFAEDRLILTDAEHAALGPRYDDLAFLYMRTWTRGDDPATARRILNTFIEMNKVDREDFGRAFAPRIAIRAAQGYHDSFIDWVKHNYTTSSHELFQLALRNDLSLLR